VPIVETQNLASLRRPHSFILMWFLVGDYTFGNSYKI
jgi:hypothetical protein